MVDERVKAVRDDELVGEGSCTFIDECFTDEELVDMLDKVGIQTASGAVNYCRNLEGLDRDAALEARWGEDDDMALAHQRDWQRQIELSQGAGSYPEE